jgi:hypothetical protein
MAAGRRSGRFPRRGRNRLERNEHGDAPHEQRGDVT